MKKWIVMTTRGSQKKKAFEYICRTEDNTAFTLTKELSEAYLFDNLNIAADLRSELMKFYYGKRVIIKEADPNIISRK